MRISCLSCGNKVELDDAYGDYQGPIKCMVCGALLEIETEDGSIKSVRLPRPERAGAAAGTRTVAE